MQNYKKIDVRGYPQTRISLSKDDSLSKDCPWMICPWMTLSKDCPWIISLIFRMQNYKKIDMRGYPQIFIDNLSNLKYYNIIKS